MSQKILGFRIGKEKHAALEQVCATLGIELVDVERRDYAQKLGVLAGVKGFARERTVYGGAELPAEMLVFSGMNSDQLDEFLAAYKATGQKPVELKAVVTPGNIFWDADTLFRELMREHIAVVTK
jgi:hypothetical protein